jgi:hypothetical protein
MYQLTPKKRSNTVLYLVHYFAKKVDADLTFCPESLIKENFLAGLFPFVLSSMFPWEILRKLDIWLVISAKILSFNFILSIIKSRANF